MMRNKGLFGSLLAVALVCVSCGGPSVENDLKDLGLRGKVKSVSEKRFHALQKENGEVVKTNFFRGESEWDYCESFDKKGNYLNIVFLDRDGDTVASNQYEYDEKGKLSFKRYYDEGKKLKMSSQYEYDMLGREKVLYELDEEGYLVCASNTEYNDENLIETCTSINNKGAFVRQTVVQKNKSGYCTDYKYFNEERVLSNWRKETHDEEGKLLEMKVLNPDESLMFKVKYEYNLQGDLVNTTPFAEEEEYMSESFVYDYDKKSNWVRKIQYLGDSLVSVTEREIEYY